MLLLSGEMFYLWIDSFFDFFTKEQFTVGDITFSFYDVFIGAVILSCFGYICGHLLLYIKDKR